MIVLEEVVAIFFMDNAIECPTLLVEVVGLSIYRVESFYSLSIWAKIVSDIDVLIYVNISTINIYGFLHSGRNDRKLICTHCSIILFEEISVCTYSCYFSFRLDSVIIKINIYTIYIMKSNKFVSKTIVIGPIISIFRNVLVTIWREFFNNTVFISFIRLTIKLEDGILNLSTIILIEIICSCMVPPN